jgi:hypothetical protein
VKLPGISSDSALTAGLDARRADLDRFTFLLGDRQRVPITISPVLITAVASV